MAVTDAQIERAIMEGDARTGVSIMRIVPKLDAGPVILQLGTPIVEDETYGELSLRLAELGAAALVESLALVELGRAVEQPQDESLATYAPKVDRDATRVDWTRDARAVARVIRAYDPRPGAFTTLDERDVKLYGARFAPRAESAQPGAVTAVDDHGLVVACAEGSVRVVQVQPSGKRRMAAAEWLRGRGIAVGQHFV